MMEAGVAGADFCLSDKYRISILIDIGKLKS
ncbi:hypothetical protein DO70_3682 [Burkholderia pseudomallei]|nr:hypothetical protein DO70_3682 [Burkholderia pseudomallei]